MRNRRVALVAFTLAAVAACGGSYDAAYPGGSTSGTVGGTAGGSTGAGGGGTAAGGGPVGAVTIGAGIAFVSRHNGTSNAAIDTIAAGTAMTWTWTGALPHSVRSVGATSFTSSDTRTGSGTYAVTFTTPGTYRYECAVHGSAMSGTIVVTGPATGTSTDTTVTSTPGGTPGTTPGTTPGSTPGGSSDTTSTTTPGGTAGSTPGYPGYTKRAA